jgi:hypothetical protein
MRFFEKKVDNELIISTALEDISLSDSLKQLVAKEGIPFIENVSRKNSDDYSSLGKLVQIAVPEEVFLDTYEEVQLQTDLYNDQRNSVVGNLKEVDANAAFYQWLRLEDGEWENHMRTDVIKTAVQVAQYMNSPHTLVVLGAGSGNEAAIAAIVRKKLGHFGRVVAAENSLNAAYNMFTLFQALGLDNIEVREVDNLSRVISGVKLEDQINIGAMGIGGVLNCFGVSGCRDVGKFVGESVACLNKSGIIGHLESPSGRIDKKDWKQFESKGFIKDGALRVLEMRRLANTPTLLINKTIFRNLPALYKDMKQIESSSGYSDHFDRVLSLKGNREDIFKNDEKTMELMRSVRKAMIFGYETMGEKVDDLFRMNGGRM